MNLDALKYIVEQFLALFEGKADKSLVDLVAPITIGFGAGHSGLKYVSDVGDTFSDLEDGKWSIGSVDLSSGVKLHNIKRSIDDIVQSQKTVLTELGTEVSIKDTGINGGAVVDLPLTDAYRLGFALPRNVSTSASDFHPFLRLATSVEKSVVLLYGYLLQADGSLQPISQADVAAPLFVERAVGDSLTNQDIDTTVVLVHVEFAFCDRKDDFEPLGAAFAARLYPRVSVWTQRPVDEINCDILFKRPPQSPSHHAHGSRKMYMSLYSDRNVEDSVDLNVFSIGIPFWNRMFDNYRIDVQGSGPIAGITDTAGERIANDIRHVRADENFPWLNLSFLSDNATGANILDEVPYIAVEQHRAIPTKLRKFPYQGELDNVHIAPAMDLNGEAVHMAPLCEHDCFHMHWRWSNGFHGTPFLGWSSSWPASGGPNEKRGMPLIPPNQTLQIVPTAAGEDTGFTYRAKATRVTFPSGMPQSRRWHCFCHHGCSYITGLAVLGEPGAWMLHALLSDVSKQFYHRIRYGRDSGGTFVPILVEEDFPAIESF